MASWRDSLSEQAQADCGGLLGQVLPFAQQMLERHGEFYPYAVKVELDGQVGMAAGDPDNGEQPASTRILELLYAGLRSERDALRASAVVAGVKYGSPARDAIRVEIEHREGAHLAVYMPYSKKGLRRRVEYGALEAGPGESRVWP